MKQDESLMVTLLLSVQKRCKRLNSFVKEPGSKKKNFSCIDEILT